LHTSKHRQHTSVLAKDVVHNSGGWLGLRLVYPPLPIMSSQPVQGFTRQYARIKHTIKEIVSDSSFGFGLGLAAPRLLALPLVMRREQVQPE
jgi:hypothetical protein